MRHDGRWVSVANVPCDTESDKIVFEDDGWPLYNPDVFGATMVRDVVMMEHLLPLALPVTYTQIEHELWKDGHCHEEACGDDVASL